MSYQPSPTRMQPWTLVVVQIYATECQQIATLVTLKSEGTAPPLSKVGVRVLLVPYPLKFRLWASSRNTSTQWTVDYSVIPLSLFAWWTRTPSLEVAPTTTSVHCTDCRIAASISAKTGSAFISPILPEHYFVTVSVICRGGPCSCLVTHYEWLYNVM